MAFEVVTGRFLAPDGSPLSGSVVFTPAFSSATDGQAVTAPAPVPAQLDDEGRLEVSLLVPGEGTQPSAWTWRACLRLRHAGGVVGLPAFNFELVAGKPVNLAEVAPVPDPVTGDYITRGEPGAPGATPEITIGQVQTVPAGQEAVTITGPAEAPTLDFALPAGRLGWTGDRGPQGLPGAPGPAGPAGQDGVGIESLGVAGAALKITTTDGRVHLLPFPAGLVGPGATGSVTTGLDGVGLATGQLLFEDSGDGTGRVWASAAQTVGKPSPPGEPATVPDTGWRDIRSLVGLPAGADPAKNRFEVLHIRRVGQMVMVLMRSANTVDKYPLAQALPGFSTVFPSEFIRVSPGVNVPEIYVSGSQLIFLGGAKNGGSINHARFTYLTADPWPAALPGTAVS